ncbi:hypothetical protein BJ508DRAFT_411948 [Ascobolus immersus RN42]|uniref:Cora-domain-containing protein n=1 Tax=Ascobolus immersus RN42 TaxID=1160509 RepID=A0A3N4IHC0_ASCIM|nr:hypothetical protein BJ508DRAFT_411948 [Ascobolus immersus RN42]
MNLVHAHSSTCDNLASLVSRERISFYGCVKNGVTIHIYLFFPRVAARRYQSFRDPHIIGNQLRQSHFFTPDPMPRFSEPLKWTSKPINNSGEGISRLLMTLLSGQQQYLDAENQLINVSHTRSSLFIYQLVASEWHITIDHFANLMTALEDDRELLAPLPNDTSGRISLMQARRLLLEYKDMIHDTLQCLQREEGSRIQPEPELLLSPHLKMSRTSTSTMLSEASNNSAPSSTSGKSKLSQVPPRFTPGISVPNATFLESIVGDFLSLDRSIHILIERANKAAAAHMSFLAIQESRRAMEQAEVVRRLTSLAFVFIPLTFTTGIFGMNVQGLQADGVSPWIPVVLAVAVTSVTLGLNWFSGRPRIDLDIFAKIERFQKSLGDAELFGSGSAGSRSNGEKV